MEPLDHLLLLFRKIGHNAVQEKGRLIEKALGRFDPFYHDAAGDGMEAKVLIGCQLFAGKDDDGQIGKGLVFAKSLQYVKPGDVGQTKIEHDAIEVSLGEGLE